MYESDVPADADPVSEPENEAATDPELDAIAADLDTVEAAMKALDADDLDQAEALASSLGADTPSGADETVSEQGSVEA